MKRKFSRVRHPATEEQQPSSSDDDGSVGVLGAYDRLLQLATCSESPLPLGIAAETAHSPPGSLHEHTGEAPACMRILRNHHRTCHSELICWAGSGQEENLARTAAAKDTTEPAEQGGTSEVSTLAKRHARRYLPR